MVLLEAMLLGKQIIATNIPGSRQVLWENPEFVVDNSVSGLTQGMVDVVEGRLPSEPVFDIELYRKAAFEGFFRACAL